jgi:hypothetical protein
MPLTRRCSTRTDWHWAAYIALNVLPPLLGGYAKGLAERQDSKAEGFDQAANLAQTGRDLGIDLMNSTLCPSQRFPIPSTTRPRYLPQTSASIRLIKRNPTGQVRPVYKPVTNYRAIPTNPDNTDQF